MGLLGNLVKTVSDVVTGGRRRGGAPSREAGRRGGRRPASPPAAGSSASSSASRADAEALPGEFGPDATVEVDPHRVGPVRMSYSPRPDGAPDPGEHRPSWVNLDRVIRVHEGGMRREAAALPRAPFERVTDRLHQRYGWR